MLVLANALHRLLNRPVQLVDVALTRWQEFTGHNAISEDGRMFGGRRNPGHLNAPL